jgi:hypothetical protein
MGSGKYEKKRCKTSYIKAAVVHIQAGQKKKYKSATSSSDFTVLFRALSHSCRPFFVQIASYWSPSTAYSLQQPNLLNASIPKS